MITPNKKMLKTSSNNMLTPAVFFLLPFLFIPLIFISWFFGGSSIILIPIYGYFSISILDFIFQSADKTDITAKNFKKYSIILWLWPFVQLFLIFGSLFVIFNSTKFNTVEAIFLMLSLGIVTGAVGITFAHELMHKKSKIERMFCDILLAMVLYSHFRTEHLLVHHRYVGTKKDPVTARFNESFYMFFLRVLPGCLISAWNVENERLLRNGKKTSDSKNPFWLYFGLILLFLTFSYFIGGVFGVLLFIIPGIVAIIHLEVINYIEHYGLSRKLLKNGKYETTKLHHSWNSNQTVSNLLLINLQRHSDHHYNPNKSYQLLNAVDRETAPQLPYGYPIMVLLSLFPSLWKKVMNPRVKEWRKQFYPEVSDWSQSLN